MAPVPRLADVRCSGIRFQPGDRILVKVFQKMDHESLRKLRNTIEKWAGDHVEVLIIDATIMDLEIEKSKLVLPSEKS